MDINYNEKRDGTIEYLNNFDNLIMAGRQGTFRYIFLDTAMETGLMAAQKKYWMKIVFQKKKNL